MEHSMNRLVRRSSPTDLAYLVPNNGVFRGAESPIRIVPPDAESVVDVVRTLAQAHLEEVWSDNWTQRYVAELETLTRCSIAHHDIDARLSIARDKNWTRRYIASQELETKIDLQRLSNDHDWRMAESDRRAAKAARKLETAATVAGKALDVLQDEVEVQVYEYSRGWFNTEQGIAIRVSRASRRR